jgi:acyl-CoA thioester hydrolase
VPPVVIIHSIRVIFGDTDQMGVVYYANYLRYFEAGRAELLRAIGSSGRHLDELGIGFPVIEAHCRYRRPARYDDLLALEVSAEVAGAARLRFRYALRRDDELLAEGTTEHACVDRSGRPRRTPEELLRRFAAGVAETHG